MHNVPWSETKDNEIYLQHKEKIAQSPRYNKEGLMIYTYNDEKAEENYGGHYTI